jgi:methyl-accepting chemotaxis protein
MSLQSPSKTTLVRRLLDVSMRTKVLGIAIGMNLLTVALLTWQGSVRIQKVYLDQLALRGRALASTVVTALEPAMLDGNHIKVLGILNDLKSEPGLAYALAVDNGGKMVAHVSQMVVAPDLPEQHPLEPGQEGPQDKVVESDGRAVLDINQPLLQGAVGSVHIGMDLAAARAEILRLLVRGVQMTLAVLAAETLALWVLLGFLVSPINRLAEATRLIVEQGDLSHEFNFVGMDEVSRLGRNFQQMLVKLREIPRRLEHSVKLIGETVQRLDEVASEQVRTVAQQAASLQETQITAEEIRQTSRTAAGQARTILASSQEADSVSAQGEEAVARSLASIQEMKAHIAFTSDRIQAFHKHMEQVKAIADTVKDLADQSNILALNAAIEAMRSGEHGKGFALVAGEIRRLADQSVRATDQVREILDTVTLSLNETLYMSVRGTRRVEAEMAEVRHSGDSLNALAGMVKTTAGSVSQIAAAVTQQDAGIGQIFSAVTRQSEMMGHTQDQVRVLRASLTQLKDLSDHLAGIVRDFKA